MVNLKVYTSLDEALKDIQFENGRHRCLEFEFFEGNELDRDKNLTPKIESAMEWLSNILEQHEQPRHIQHNILEILGELIVNAYRHVNQNEKCSAEIYVGKKGVLSGTKQKYGFLTEEQIGLLKSGKCVSSTKDEPGGGGTDIFVDVGDGIFIDESEKAIYVLKYF